MWVRDTSETESLFDALRSETTVLRVPDLTLKAFLYTNAFVP